MLFIFVLTQGDAQNSARKWYFGNKAGLDFLTSPPTILTNSSMHASEGSSSIADAAGNLLFYTNGDTVWTSQHNVMSNGTGLLGNNTPFQSSVIIRKPGNTSQYYIFTVQGVNGNAGFNYSVVNMSLASGQGSITVKNSAIYSAPCAEKIAATVHCNGVDYWIIVHEHNSNNFRSYLLTSNGVNTTATVTSIGSIHTLPIGGLKLSPNGKKLGTVVYYAPSSSGNAFEIFDFNNSTGLLSNYQPLAAMTVATGCEFSPDGSKFYGGRAGVLYQWNVCAGTTTAISASQFTIATSGGALGNIQLGPDGKIYVSKAGSSTLGVINNPNTAGAGCNYNNTGQSVSPKISTQGLPYFINSMYRPLSGPFSFTANVSCQTASYTAPAIQTMSNMNCSISGFSVAGMEWDFGDPLSSSNTSTLSNPVHVYTNVGTYTAQLVINYGCGGGTDTVRQIVNITMPCISISSSSITCASLGSATATPIGSSGPFNYTWMPGNQTGSVVSGLIPGTHTLLVSVPNSTTTATFTTYLSPLVPLTATVSATSSLLCSGAGNGTANITNITGGSGNQTYIWTDGISAMSTPSVNSLTAGSWSVTVTDALTGCQVFSVFIVTEPGASTLQLTANQSSACIGQSIVLTGVNSGGTPAYNYTWTNGPNTNTYAVSATTGGSFIYSLSSTDMNSCLATGTISVDFIINPILSVSNVSICPLATGILSVTGANSYTWTSLTQSAIGVTFSDAPSGTSQYTVIGSALGCSAAATASIVLHPLPTAVMNHNTPVCNLQSLTLHGTGGSSYVWKGPLNFASAAQSITLSTVTPFHSGVYQLTVTSAEGCTAATSASLTVHPTPTLSANAGTVCTSHTLQLTANSTGSGFLWTGPQNFSSSQQNPNFINPSVAHTGIYTVSATSIYGCTNSAVAVAKVVPPPSLTVALSSPSLCYQAFNGSPNTITLTSSGADTYSLFTPNLIGSSGAGPSSSLSTLPPFSTSTTVGTGTLEGSNGICTAFTTFTYSILPNPTVSLNSYTPVICAGQNFTYTSNGAQSYSWGPNSVGLNTYTSPVVVANPTLTSVFSVVGGSMGCNSPTQTTTLTVYPVPTITIFPISPTICLNEKINLNANGTGTSYSWSPTFGLTPTIGPSVLASPKVTQKYTVIAAANNCTNSANIILIVHQLPTPIITADKTKLCVNEEIRLKGSGGLIYNWSGPGALFATGESLLVPAGSIYSGGEYTLTTSDERGCKNNTKINIVVNALPQGSLLGLKGEGCVPLCSNLNFVPNGSQNITSNWEINKQVFTDKFNYCFYDAGQYIVNGTLYDANTTCKNKVSFSVLVHPKPEADFSYQPVHPVENLEKVIFTNTSQGEEQTEWSWFFHDEVKSQQNSNYLYSEAGTFPVVMLVRNKYHCSDTIIKNVKVESDFNFYVPNTFTPNGDDRNDIFMPVTQGIKKYSLSIYDRWGERIFYSLDHSSGWDGTFQGIECKAEVYSWKVVLTTSSSEQKDFAGHVTLLR